MTAVRVFIVDDHRIFRQGIMSLLGTEKEISVVGEATTPDECLEYLGREAVDVLLLDLDLGRYSGMELAVEVRKHHPGVRLLALSMHGEREYILKALETGVTGYLMKNTGREELVTAIRTVASGNSYLDNEASTVLMQYLQSPSVRKESDSEEMRLTPRETEVLKLIALEYSNAEIAEKLFISIRTVDTHRRNLIEKLKLKNTAGLVKWAIKNKLIGQE